MLPAGIVVWGCGLAFRAEESSGFAADARHDAGRGQALGRDEISFDRSFVMIQRIRIPLVAALASLGGGLVTALLVVSTPSPSSLFSTHPAWAFSGGQTRFLADVAERVTPSVVNIASTRRIEGVGRHAHGRFPFFGPPGGRPRGLQQGQGSGVIISSDGVVVTNNHVVKGATKVRVTLHDKRVFDAKVLGTDPKSDLAVLKLKGASGLRPLPLGESARLRLGDFVLAVGNPFGIGQTVTMGIVSAKGRANVGLVDYEDFIQTDAAINPGNSGGALVNLRGELIGINTAILSRSGGYQGIGFAIPSDMAKPIIGSLRSGGKVVRGYIGVMIQNATPELAQALGLPHTNGVLIADVVPQGPAALAGVRRGDFVVAVNGQSVTSSAQLRNAVASLGASHQAKLELLRNGKKLTLDLKTKALPGKGALAMGGDGRAALGASGLHLGPLSPENRRGAGIPPRVRHGVVVEDVEGGSPAANAGLRPGDVILEANRVKMDSVRRFSQVYAASKRTVLLLVYRRGSTLFLPLPK